MFDMTEFDKLVGTTRTDQRGLTWTVEKVKYCQATKHTPAMVSLSGSVTDHQVFPRTLNDTTFGAFAYETIYV